MDLSQYNPIPASSEAKRFDLIDPFSGKAITDENDDALGYSIVGMQSTIARNEDARIQREYIKPEGDPAKMTERQRAAHEEDVREYALREGCKKIAAMITELHGNWEYNGKALTASDKVALADMLMAQEWVANQAHSNANNLRNYSPKKLAASKSTSDTQAG